MDSALSSETIVLTAPLYKSHCTLLNHVNSLGFSSALRQKLSTSSKGVRFDAVLQRRRAAPDLAMPRSTGPAR